MLVLPTESSARRPHNCKFAVEKAYPDGISLADPVWEMRDPTPDIHALFRKFDADYFWNTLWKVKVKWTNRLMRYAGVFGRRECLIALSLPLLKFRPRKDLVATLLHEMIHAYLFVTNNQDNDDWHGYNFREQMFRVNKLSGANITVSHRYLLEMEYFRQHIWRCNGPCQFCKPHFGYFRRTRNQPPGPADYWWVSHAKICNGLFIEIKEPQMCTSRKRKTPDVDEYNEYGEQCGIFGPPPGVGLPPVGVSACKPTQFGLSVNGTPSSGFPGYGQPPSAGRMNATPTGAPKYGPNPKQPVYGPFSGAAPSYRPTTSGVPVNGSSPRAVSGNGPSLNGRPGCRPQSFGWPSRPGYRPKPAAVFRYGPPSSAQPGYRPPPSGLPGYGPPSSSSLVYGSTPSGSRPTNRPVYTPQFSDVPRSGPPPRAVRVYGATVRVTILLATAFGCPGL
ncbi:uncharacterized protein LOC129590707 [Paramacrobiotus metropolitanus]|uniref:uncharacterized protein LOC129590707 n=1 Tax=Paramacrobiotus metropolitanus TaxID=2943436 RepID=UPI002446238B|nr:uncharacterized protein LOC129590707 [Paramacrobiotus metropolitanus]